jgi:hypothetical protein
MPLSKEDENSENIWRTSPFPNPSETGSLHCSLEQYELSSLQCPCCHFFYDNPVTLRPCHHSFCNQCIRRHLGTRNGAKNKRDCPLCHGKIEIKRSNGAITKKLDDDEAIIPNYGLQVSRHYLQCCSLNLVIIAVYIYVYLFISSLTLGTRIESGRRIQTNEEHTIQHSSRDASA